MYNTINLENFKVSIFKSKKHIHLYIYNNTYYCMFKVADKLKISFKTNKKIEIKTQSNLCLITKLNLFLKQFYFYEFTKIKFTGKGYKIKKNSNRSMVLLFNRAHTTTLWWKNTFIKKLKKYKIYVKYNHTQKKIIDTVLGIRPVNIFTKKGLRKSRQILFKKKGKK